MKKFARRSTALALGTLGAVLTLLGALQFGACNVALPAAWQTHVTPLDIEEAASFETPQASDVLTVALDSSGRREFPYQLESRSRSPYGKLVARYLGLRGERRTVALELEPDGSHARVRTQLDTDYGTYPGRIDPDASRLVRHGDVLTFRLSVVCVDGSSNDPESWNGSVALR